MKADSMVERGMSRADFLKLLAKATGVAAAAPLVTPLGLSLAAEPAPVLRRPIPSSGELVPVIGVGTAVVYEIETTDPKFPNLVESIRTFLTQGGALIDTSPTYGRAEKNLGEIFRRTGLRKNAFLCDKISTSGEQSGINQVTTAMKDMEIDRFDLLQVHNIRDTQTHLRTIRRLKDEGKVRYVGITTSFPKTYPEFVETIQKEKLDFIQIDYALDNRTAEERILPAARDRGVAVLTALPFGRGRLFQKAAGKPLPPFAAEIDCTSWAQFFLKFLLSHPAINAVIPGTDRPEFAIDNLNAARGRIPDAAMRARMLKYWDSL